MQKVGITVTLKSPIANGVCSRKLKKIKIAIGASSSSSLLPGRLTTAIN